MRLSVVPLLLLSRWASAGDHRPLCTKVDEATQVVEIAFEQRANWSNSYQEKAWPPPESELRKTAETGTVVHSFKGGWEVGAQWEADWGLLFRVNGIPQWENFMRQDQFRQIWFMDGQGGSTGWAEESAGCGSSDRSSWCEDYNEFKTRIEACLAPDGPPENLEEPTTTTVPKLLDSDAETMNEADEVLPETPPPNSEDSEVDDRTENEDVKTGCKRHRR